MTQVSRLQAFYKDFYLNSNGMRLLVISNPFNFKIVETSNPFLETLGYTKDELISFQSITDLYHPDCYETVHNARDLYLKQGYLNNCDLILKTKNGNKLFVSLDILAAKDKEGNIQFSHYLYRDISDSSDKNLNAFKVQEELDSLNEAFVDAQEFYLYFYDLYDDAPDMFASVTARETVVTESNKTTLSHCNNTFAQKLGYTKEEALSISLDDLYHPDCFDEYIKQRDHLFTHGFASNWELQLKKKNGDKLLVSLNAKSLKNKQGQVIGGIGMYRDITDLVETRYQLKETNDLLTHQNKELKTLIHILSHDIQSPIRAIANFTQFVLEENKDNLSITSLEYMYKLQTNAKRLHRLAQDTFTYFFKGDLETIEKVKLKDIIDQALGYLDLPSSIKIHLNSDIQHFKTKRTPLAQTLYNLISNAIKYHHNLSEAEIYINVLDIGEYLRFTIKDNGPGIPKKFHETVFEPLQRLKIGKNVEGSGMGLAIVKKLITQEGGEIRLESEPGKGSTFTFSWPKEDTTYELNHLLIRSEYSSKKR